MSAFLGHIHYWLYKKIQLLAERENLVLEKTRSVIDDLADELHEMSVDTYGSPIDPATPLEDIIDHGNIHGWLQGQITTASVRARIYLYRAVDDIFCDRKRVLVFIFCFFKFRFNVSPAYSGYFADILCTN